MTIYVNICEIWQNMKIYAKYDKLWKYMQNMTYMQNRTICENYDKIYNNMAKQKYQYVQNMTKYDKFNKKWSI